MIPKNSTPRTIATKVVVMPIMPVAIPSIITIPSFPINPKDVIKMPIPGRKLVNGRGINIDIENIKIKIPIILSKMPVLRNISLGFSSFSALQKYTDDFSIILASTVLAIVFFDITRGSFGDFNPAII